MMRRLGYALLLAGLALPAQAQVGRTDFEDLRPKDMQFPDNLGMEDLPIGPVPEAAAERRTGAAPGARPPRTRRPPRPRTRCRRQ